MGVLVRGVPLFLLILYILHLRLSVCPGYSSNVGTELKEKESYVSEHRASEVKVSLDEPTKEEPA